MDLFFDSNQTAFRDEIDTGLMRISPMTVGRPWTHSQDLSNTVTWERTLFWKQNGLFQTGQKYGGRDCS